jgi:hypothetical protein
MRALRQLLAIVAVAASARGQPPPAAAAPDAGAPPAQAAGQLPEATPLAIDLRVEPEEITLGQHVIVRLAVEHDPRDVYTLPRFDPAPLTVPQGAPPPAHVREELKGRARTTFTLVLTDLASLDPRIPDLTLHVTGPDGERALTVRGRPLKFKSLVESEHQGAPDAAHHGPKPPVPVLVRSWLWAGLIAVLAGLAGLAFATRKLLKRREAARKAMPVPAMHYDDRALLDLARLRKERPWERGAGRAAIFQLSEIVRTYLGSRLEFNALDLTSEELIAQLKQRRLMGLDLPGLAEETSWQDLVKFAKVEPTSEECLRGIERAELMVRHTRPLRSLPPTGRGTGPASGPGPGPAAGPKGAAA